MRIFNKEKTKELTEMDIDFEKGYLVDDKLFIAHHQAVQAVEEQGHYETIAEYPNGGKDVAWVVDVPKVEAREAYDEYEEIQVFIPYTEKELAQRRIALLKGYLAETDYQAIKYAEGVMPEHEYAEMKAQRQVWRNEINELEKVI